MQTVEAWIHQLSVSVKVHGREVPFFSQVVNMSRMCERRWARAPCSKENEVW